MSYIPSQAWHHQWRNPRRKMLVDKANRAQNSAVLSQAIREANELLCINIKPSTAHRAPDTNQTKTPMKTSEAFPSNFIKADDLNGQNVTVTISKVELEEIGQGRDKESKLVISFAGKEKKLICNKTNANTITKLYGDETDEWVGKKITIGPREVEFQGDMVWAIRVSLAKPGAPASKPGAAQPVRHVAPRPEPGPAQEQEGREPEEQENIPF